MALTESCWGSTGAPVLETTVGGVLRAAAEATPDAPALTGGSPDPARRPTWTYAELLDESERTARALLARFAPGDHVAIWAHNVPQWVILEYGMGLAGIVLITVNPALRPEEGRYVLDQSKARGVFTVDVFRDQALTKIASELQTDLPLLEHVISIDRWDEFLASDDADTELPEVRPDDPAQVQYTSGTTGFPKGARLHHRGITNNARLIREELGPPGVPTVTPMPLFHTAGCVISVLGASVAGDHLVVLEQFDPGLHLELIESYRAAFMFGVPTMLIADINHPDFATRDITSLDYVVSGGAMVPPDLVREIESSLGASFQIVYGQTELSPVCNMITRRRHHRRQGQHRRQAAWSHRHQGGRGGVRRRRPVRRRRRDLRSRLPRDDRLLRHGRQDGGDHRCGGLAPHRRPRHDGRSWVRGHHRPAQGHDHPGRREPVPGRDREPAVPAPHRSRRSPWSVFPMSRGANRSVRWCNPPTDASSTQPH